MTRDRSAALPARLSVARRLFFRCGCIASAALVLSLPRPARADVIGFGDVTPAIEDEESGELIPDLPIEGGTVDGTIIVGGTGQMIGDTDTGQMTIDSPAFTAPLISERGVIGGGTEGNPVGSGIVQIFSIGSQWRITEGEDGLLVGEFGQGLLELINGGQVSDDPPGDLVQTDLEVVVGKESGSQGFINARGVGSLLRSDRLVVGESGFGSVSLTTRASIQTLDEAIIGEINDLSESDIGTGFVTVDGAFTRWTIGGPAVGRLVVGDQGRGALNVVNQGEVRITDQSGEDGEMIIGNQLNSLGEVLVSGQFSQLWSFGTITVGSDSGGRGVLRITNQAQVRANDSLEVGEDGVLEISGGTLLTPIVTNRGVIQTSVGGIGQIDSAVNNVSFGEIRSAGTADRVRERLIFTRTVANSGLITSIGGEMEFTAPVLNDGTIAGRDAIYRFRGTLGGLVNNGLLGFSVGDSDVFGAVDNNSLGSIAVANDSNVTFYGDVVNNGSIDVLPGGSAIFLQNLTFGPSAQFNVQLAEQNNLELIGQLQIADTASLDGTLLLQTFASLEPEPGDSYQIISAGRVTGTFANFIPPSNAPGNNWTVEYTPTSVILNFVAAPTFNADFNGDGVVNTADRLIWAMNLGTGTTQMQGDANFDGIVDGQDFLIWMRQLGPVPTSATPNLAGVPEPGALALALPAALVALVRRRRR